MTEAQLRVAEAEANLVEAKAQARGQRVEDARAKLREVRNQAKLFRRELRKITAEVLAGDQGAARCRGQLADVDAAIWQLNNAPRDILDEPCGDEAELTTLRRQRQEVIADLRACEAMTGRRLRAVEIANSLQYLQCTANNLLNVIEHHGELKAGWEGSVNRV